MNVSQAITYFSSYIKRNINDINKIYSFISEKYLDFSKIDIEDKSKIKEHTNKFQRDLEELFDDAKLGRDQALEAYHEIIHNKEDSEVIFGCSNFLAYENELTNHKVRSEKLYKSIEYTKEKYDIHEDDDEWFYKLLKYKVYLSSAKRLLNLIEADIKSVNNITEIYETKKDEE